MRLPSRRSWPVSGDVREIRSRECDGRLMSLLQWTKRHLMGCHVASRENKHILYVFGASQSLVVKCLEVKVVPVSGIAIELTSKLIKVTVLMA